MVCSVQAAVDACSKEEVFAITLLVAMAKKAGKAKVENDGRSVKDAGSSVLIICGLVRSLLAQQCVLVVSQ